MSAAVAEFLIPEEEEDDDDNVEDFVAVEFSVEDSCFFRFFELGAFFRLCVRPCSARFRARAMRRAFSSSRTGRMGMILSSV